MKLDFSAERHDGILPEAVRTFRERRGWTHEQMADEVWASPTEVAAWEAGTIRVPEEQASHIRVLTATDERYAAIIAARLPSCAWANANMPDVHERLCLGPYPVNLSLPAQRHLGECGTCRSVLRSARMVKAPPPVQAPNDWLAATLAFAGYLVFLILLFKVFQAFPQLGEAVGNGAIAYALLAGLGVFRLAARWLDRLWKRWPYPAALLSALAGTFTGLLVWMFFSGPPEVGFGVLAGCAAVAVLVGAVAGWWTGWIDSDDDEDEAPVDLLPGQRVPEADADAVRPHAPPVLR